MLLLLTPRGHGQNAFPPLSFLLLFDLHKKAKCCTIEIKPLILERPIPERRNKLPAPSCLFSYHGVEGDSFNMVNLRPPPRAHTHRQTRRSSPLRLPGGFGLNTGVVERPSGHRTSCLLFDPSHHKDQQMKWWFFQSSHNIIRSLSIMSCITVHMFPHCGTVYWSPIGRPLIAWRLSRKKQEKKANKETVLLIACCCWLLIWPK